MANYYCQSSSFISIPEEKIPQAKEVLKRIEHYLIDDSDEGYCGFTAEFEGGGVWIYGEESVNEIHMELLVKALVQDLDLPGVHVCSWAYTCSKPRIDEFGGGAFAVQKDRDTIWIDAATEARRLVELSAKED